MSVPTQDSGGFKAQLDQMTEKLVAVERRAETLAELNRLMVQGGDPTALVQRAVDLVKRATKAAGTFVYIWDPEIERLVLRVATTGRQAAHVGEIQLRLGEGVTGWTGLMRQTVRLDEDIQSDPRFVNFSVLEEHQFHCMVAVPVAVPGGELLGVFSLYAGEPAAFDTHDVELATEVGSLLANGLVHAQTVKDLRRESAVSRFLMTLPADATSSLQRCVDVIAEAIRDQADAAFCSLELAERGTPDGNVRPGLAFADDVDNAVVVSARSVRARAELHDLAQQIGSGLEKLTISFGTLFPLGAITCYRARPFTEADKGIVDALAAQAATLVSSLSCPAMTTPLAGRLAGAPTRESADRLLRDLGWRPGPTQPVQVQVSGTRYTTPSAFERVVDALREMRGGIEGMVLVPSAPVVSLLVPYQPEQWKGFEHALRTTIRQLRTESNGGVTAGIGPVANDVSDLVSALESAETAGAWAQLLGDRGSVAHHEDFAHLRLLPRVALDIGEDLRDVLTRISEVIRYDLRNGTALASTLEDYLANRCSVTDTASDLFIHRNTLRQRLGRIEELVGRPVEGLGDWAVAALAARLALAGEPRLVRTQARNAASGE
ncbi:GAF domain-containing protein [Saccharopolyspora spinosa]|uniref:GAF domain-containing protein n=2 Tax=Saccharopolyspora spinosa TaxID=60894 RepID=A0A2N3Y0J6_SACSN|nr:GAF domain-containing protein [Saccharopolyspora spinosa]